MALIQFDSTNSSHDELTNTGYDIELFVQPNKANEFVCVICQFVAKRPRTHHRLPNIACKVIFCFDCLKDYIRHHENSLTTEEDDAACPFRCGVSLITRGHNKNIGGIPRTLFRKLGNLKMLCPFGRGTVRYIDYEKHQLNTCDCNGFSSNERRTLEKRIDSMLNKICDNNNEDDETELIRNFAQIIIDSLYPD